MPAERVSSGDLRGVLSCDPRTYPRARQPAPVAGRHGQRRRSLSAARSRAIPTAVRPTPVPTRPRLHRRTESDRASGQRSATGKKIAPSVCSSRALIRGNWPRYTLSLVSLAAFIATTFVFRTGSAACGAATPCSAQTDIDLARAWGGGEVASADGLRFVVPVRTLNAGPNPRYFGPGRGVTYLNFLSDQFSGFHAVVVPGTLRDSLYILEGLLEQHTSLRPAELMTDNAGYTDQVFGLFRLLGYQFSPRLADLGDSRFWRTNPDADYGPLNGIARHRVNTDLIASSWDDLLRVAGSLSTGTVRASEILRVLQGGGRPTPTGRAIAELGRIAKSLYLLAYLDDEPYRRRILTQLNRIEARHALARQVFHGQRGQLRQRYREGQEDQLGALGLVLNAIVLWNTRYLDAALTQLRRDAYPVEDADVERLSPLIHDHINLLGRYHFTNPDRNGGDQLQPLRDPRTADD